MLERIHAEVRGPADTMVFLAFGAGELVKVASKKVLDDFLPRRTTTQLAGFLRPLLPADNHRLQFLFPGGIVYLSLLYLPKSLA